MSAFLYNPEEGTVITILNAVFDIHMINEITIAHLRIDDNDNILERIPVQYSGGRKAVDILTNFEIESSGLDDSIKEIAREAIGEWSYDANATNTAYDLVMKIGQKNLPNNELLLAIAYFNDTEQSILEMVGTPDWPIIKDGMDELTNKYAEVTQTGDKSPLLYSFGE